MNRFTFFVTSQLIPGVFRALIFSLLVMNTTSGVAVAQQTAKQKAETPPVTKSTKSATPQGALVAVDKEITNGIGKLRIRIMRSSGIDLAHPAFANMPGGSRGGAITRYSLDGSQITPDTFDSIVILFDFLAPEVKDLSSHIILDSNGKEIQFSQFLLYGQIHIDVPKKIAGEELSFVFRADSGDYPPVRFRSGSLPVDNRKYPYFVQSR